MTNPVTTAPAGEFRGISNGDTNAYLGIRYAQPPVGDARFQPPRPVTKRTDTIDATRFGNRNFQVGWPEEVFSGIELAGEESEDCLFLNVFTPASISSPCPVLVWIHGGAFMCGCANEYDPTNLVRDNNVIVVSINYRLGIFGFLNLAPFGQAYAGSANLGIQDQIAALHWVRDNIAAFGGDVSNVSIWGESAGAASVLTLLGAPAAEGLFHKAMVFSGGETLTPSLDQLPLIKASLGCESDEECLAQLLAMPAEDLSKLQQTSGFYPGPSLDGAVVTRPTCEAIRDGGAARIPVLAGATRDEGTLLAPAYAQNADMGAAMVFALSGSIARGDGTAYRAFLEDEFPDDIVEQVSRAWFDTFRASALRVAATAAMHGAGGWVYNFDVETDHPLGITHFADVPFTFNWIQEDNPRLFVHPATDTNRQLAEQWSKTVIAFARTGSPNGEGLPEWPQYKPDTCHCLRLAGEPAIVSNPDGDLIRIYRVGEE